MSFHKYLDGANLHNSKIVHFNGNPNGSVVATIVGEMCIDIDNNAIYTANDVGTDSWVLVGGSGDITTISALTDVNTTGREDQSILEWDEETSTHVYANRHIGDAGLLDADVVYTDNGDGTVTVNAIEVLLYDNPDNVGQAKRYTIDSDTFLVPENDTFYVVARYNAGTPIMDVITDVDLITESDVVPILTGYRIETDLWFINWDTLGDGLGNKLHMRFVKTDRFAHEQGLTLSEVPTRVVQTTSGIVWYGSVRTDIPAFSSGTDEWTFWYHDDGVWTRDLTTTTYNNTQYDNGTNLQPLSNYVINWIYRCSCNPARGAYVLSGQYSSLAEAQAAQPPVVPDVLRSLHFLVGRIIVKGNEDTGFVETSFGKEFTSTPVSEHNNLAGLNEGDYRHLTLFEYNKSVPRYSQITSDYTLTVEDYTVGVLCSTSNITITLPSAVGLTGKIYNIKKIDPTGYKVILATNGSEEIDGEDFFEISFQWTNMTVQSTGSAWIIL